MFCCKISTCLGKVASSLKNWTKYLQDSQKVCVLSNEMCQRLKALTAVNIRRTKASKLCCEGDL